MTGPFPGLYDGDVLEITHEPPLTQTRNRILEALMRHPDSRVVDIAGELEMTAGSLRRHLDILAAEGYVQSRPIRRGQGRPFLAYSATERAQDQLESFRDWLQSATVDMLDEIEKEVRKRREQLGGEGGGETGGSESGTGSST